MQTKIAPTHHEIAELLVDDTISEMTKYLMEDYDYTLENALDAVYTSRTLELLQNENGELYIQSPAYIYELLIDELGLTPIWGKKQHTVSTVRSDNLPLKRLNF